MAFQTRHITEHSINLQIKHSKIKHIEVNKRAKVTHIFCVSTVDVHLSQAEVWQYKISRGKLSGLVIVLECLIIVILEHIKKNTYWS